jgi:hypothetical protein
MKKLKRSVLPGGYNQGKTGNLGKNTKKQPKNKTKYFPTVHKQVLRNQINLEWMPIVPKRP